MNLSSTRLALALVLPFAVVWLAPSSATGQIAADRPGFGDGTTTVAPGTVQAELGAAAANDDFGTNGELGQLLLRYGVADVLELRGGVGSVALDAPGTEYTGTSVGGKLRLAQSSLSAFSLVSTWTLPTGTGAFESDRVSQTLALAYDGALGEGLGISVNGGTEVPYGGDADPSYLFIPTLSVDLADGIGAYVGYAGFYSTGLNTNYVEAGLSLLSSPDTQLDVNTGLQIDEDRSAFVAGLGLAHRF
ncbi:transporter [Salinibacter sp.]|uniref:transporter n=1 Tax=Salinibacter sp. TaxID=2065818 RepID=UPI0021E707EF|nr:transporter [Salinibacter sp.]